MALFHSDVGEVDSGRRWYSLVLNGEHKTEKEDKIGSSIIKLISLPACQFHIILHVFNTKLWTRF